MRAILLMLLLTAAIRADDAFGNWEMDPARSTFAGDPPPKSLTVRIEPRAKGEVFTVDRIEPDGRATTSSTILYLDGKPRTFQEPACSGTQSSRRWDNGVVEIVRQCDSGESIRLLRRRGGQPKDLILDVAKRQADGRVSEQHLVLEKQ
jgi:hypothetical protein